MDAETDKLVDDCEQTWSESKTLTIPNVMLDDAPLTEWKVRAHAIFAGECWEALDAIVCRLADAIPEGVTEENYALAKPLAGVAKKWYGSVEKLRKGLKRPALDWGNSVDAAAKETIDRAAPTLDPIIDAVKKIDDRKKAEKLAAEEAERKREADEAIAAQKAIEDAERARIKTEQDAEREKVAAERKKIEEAAAANRKEADRLAAERKEMEELKAWLAEQQKIVVSKETPPVVQALEEYLGATMADKPEFANPTMTDDRATWPPTLRPDFDDHAPEVVLFDNAAGRESAKFTNDELQSIMFDAETSALHAKAGVEVDPSADQQKVRDFGLAIKTAVDALKRPLLVKHEAKQAVDLAVFDIYGVANSLQEWSMP